MLIFVDMNVLNVETVERELRQFGALAVHPEIKRWVATVARNHILKKLGTAEALANFVPYDPANRADPLMPSAADLPTWAVEAMARGETLYWFSQSDPNRRAIWQSLMSVILWFNTFKANDTRLRRCDRISFNTASTAAAVWFNSANSDIWLYIRDNPPIVHSYSSKFRWVKLHTRLHFEREGNLMSHCVGNGGYFQSYTKGQSEIYSLRDEENRPHCTVQVSSGSVIQCKGFRNQRPNKEVQPYLRSFFTEQGWQIQGDSGNVD